MKNARWYIVIIIFLGFFLVIIVTPVFMRDTFGDFVHEVTDGNRMPDNQQQRTQ